MPEQINCDRKGDWMQMRSGGRFWPMDPDPEDVHISDIAHALSMQCRFGGHTRRFVSVAQHSVIVSLACDPADALWGLLHDAPEAYLVDLPRPIKHLPEMSAYCTAEAGIMLAVCVRFGLDWAMPRSVHVADNRVLAAEARDQMSPLHPGWSRWMSGNAPWPGRIRSWPAWYAKRRFLRRFRELT